MLLSSDIEINLGPKSSSREWLSTCHWNLNGIFLDWDPHKSEQLLQGMELKEKESQKGKVCGRNVRFGPLDTNWEFLSFGDLGNLGTYCEGPQWGSGQIPGKYLTIWHL